MGIIRYVHTKFFGRYLWITNTLSSGVLLAVGDGIQQGIEFSRRVNATKSYDFKRTGRLFLVGLSQGPPHHIFYSWLDKKFPLKTAKTIIKKILIDEIVAAPFFAITFFMVAGMLEGKSFLGFWTEFKNKFPAIYLFDWCLWPPTQAINFYFIPPPYRVLYINAVTVLWDVFLSYMKHYDQEKKFKEKDNRD